MKFKAPDAKSLKWIVPALVIGAGVVVVVWIVKKLGAGAAAVADTVTGKEDEGQAVTEKSAFGDVAYYGRGSFIEPTDGGGGDVAVIGSTYPMAVELESKGPPLHGTLTVKTVEFMAFFDPPRTYQHSEVGITIPGAGKAITLKWNQESTTAAAQPISAVFGRKTIATIYFNEVPLKTITYTTSGSVVG